MDAASQPPREAQTGVLTPRGALEEGTPTRRGAEPGIPPAVKVGFLTRSGLTALCLCLGSACGERAQEEFEPPQATVPRAPATTERDCDISPAARAVACPSADDQARAQETRARLLSADSPAAAAALLGALGGRGEGPDSLLRETPDLRGIARLVALDRPRPQLDEAALAAALEDPLAAQVSPIDDRVLAMIVLAGQLRHERTATHTARIKANALLARTYDEALLQLGLTPRAPLPPLARVLAGRFLHYGRHFVSAQRRRRVPGLDDLATTLERRLLEVLLAVEATPYAADDGLPFSERSAARRYLQGKAVAQRLQAAEGDPTPQELMRTWVSEVDRLIEGGFVDQAIDLSIAYSRRLGSDPIEAHRLSALQAHHREDGRRRAVVRFTELRAQEPPPPRVGEEPLPEATRPAWPEAQEVVAPLFDRLSSPAPRRRSLAQALLTLRARPDAAVYALAQFVPETRASTESRRSDLVAEIDWLLPEVEAAAPLTGTTLRLAVAAERIRTPAEGDASERSMRRRFALAAQRTQARDDAKAAEQLLANRPQALELGETDTGTDTDTGTGTDADANTPP